MLLSPIFNDPIFTDNSGNPLAGGKIFQYEAGSNSVLQTTYSDQAGTVANPNPIVLDSSGRLPGETAIWLQPGQLYNLVLTLPDGTTVLKSFDDVSGVLVSSGGGGTTTASVWVEQAATFLSPTSFLVVGNLTANYAPGNRVRVLQAGPTFIYGTVVSSTFGGGNTTVIITTASGALNSSVERGDYSILTAPGQTVDAAGVTYNYNFNYTDPQSIGFEVKDLRNDLTEEANQVNRLNTTYATSGSGTDTPYTITASPVPTGLSADSVWSVRFVNAAMGNATLNVNGLGAKRLRSYNSSGALVNATIPAGLVSTVTYDQTNDCYIVQNRIPQPLTATPRGSQVFGANGTWTCPAGVSFAKVTCVGGGGGAYESIDATLFRGGCGAISETYVSVTPGTGYNVVVGAGGGAGGFFLPSQGTSGGSSTFGGTLASASGGAVATNTGVGADASTGTGFVYPNLGAPYGVFGLGGLYGVGGINNFTLNGNNLNGTQGFVYVEW